MQETIASDNENSNLGSGNFSRNSNLSEASTSESNDVNYSTSNSGDSFTDIEEVIKLS